jgi:hypothetical protein
MPVRPRARLSHAPNPAEPAFATDSLGVLGEIGNVRESVTGLFPPANRQEVQGRYSAPGRPRAILVAGPVGEWGVIGP